MKEIHVLLIFVASYALVAKPIFDYVYYSSKNVIDEWFHLPMGLKYCMLDFSTYDHKITTLPGLYLISALFTAPIGTCNIYALRFVVFLASLANIAAVFYVRKEWLPKEDTWMRLLNTANIAIIPPVFFFSTVYYTDIMSMMLVNLMILFGLRQHLSIAVILGFVSVVTRQNNIAYILFIAGYRTLGHVHAIIVNLKEDKDNKIVDKWDTNYLCNQLKHLESNNINLDILQNLLIDGFSYLLPFISFLSFIVINGGVVVGDKSAHTTAIHLPQLFYFSLFVLFFAWPHILSFIKPFILFVYRKFMLSFLCLSLIVIIIKFNTIVHPYLLADNRHYLFYAWRRALGTPLLRLCWAPVYLFGGYCVSRWMLGGRDPLFAIVYAPMLTLILCTQALIDVRYFLTPYVILRTYASTTKCALIVEFVFHAIVSALTLYVFGHKEVHWAEFNDPQRIIW